MGLAVHPRWRRRGIAARLTLARLEWAWSRTDVVWYFREVTRNFSYPGITFNHSPGVLFCASHPGEGG
jgi:GNAT superfamily N-acetyltransferase